jgi:HSP20 family molecular chaperone IbpA
MKRTFQSFFGDQPTLSTATPAVDVRRDEDKYVLEADLPGTSEDDVDVSLDGRMLTISSDATEEREEDDSGYMIKERRHHSFRRSFTLPDDADRKKIDAAFKNGVLTVEIPRSETAKPKKISVKGG